MIKLPRAVPTCVAVSLCAITGVALAAGQSTTPGATTQTQQREHTQHQSGQSEYGQTQQQSETRSMGQAETEQRTAMSGPLTDRTFVQQAAQSNLFELQASQLALQRAQDREVRDFAQQLIQDHTQASTRLQSIAQQNDVQVPQQLGAEHQQMLQQLRAQSGSGFDGAYLRMMEQAHEKDVQLFQQAAKSQGLSQELQTFANQTLPTLRSHHRMVSDVRQGETRAAEAPTTQPGSGQQSGTQSGQQSDAETQTDPTRR